VDILVSYMGVWESLLNTKWLLPHDVLIVKAKGTSVRRWINWQLNRSCLRSQVTKEHYFEPFVLPS